MLLLTVGENPIEDENCGKAFADNPKFPAVTYFLNPVVGVFWFTNTLLLPDITVSPVEPFPFIIRLITLADDVKCADADVYDLPTNIIEPDTSVIVKKLPDASLNVWSPVNTLEPVVANEPVLIEPPPPLPVSTVKANVDASPFVNVIVFRFTDAVTIEDAVIAEVA